MADHIFSENRAAQKPFLPAAKPTGHGTVRVVVVVGEGDYFEIMTLKFKVNFFFQFFPLHTVLPP